MDEPNSVSAVAHIIQLSIAPVFLLAGIGSILNVLAARLARVIDRARAIEAARAPSRRSCAPLPTANAPCWSSN